MSDLHELIEKQIEDYTLKYANKHHITTQEAREHMMVKLAEQYYRKNERINYDTNG